MKMLKGILVLLAAGSLVAGCKNYQADIDRLNSEKDSILAAAQTKDQTITEFVETFNEIEGNLSLITQKQHTINMKADANPEMAITARERINSEIKEINELMEDSKKQLASLNKKLKNSTAKIGKLEKLIASLNDQIAQKDTELATLNEKLQTMSTEIATLNTNVTNLQLESTAKGQVIADQAAKLNTAYVAVGPYKTLEAEKVVVKEGGFLGIGREKEFTPAAESKSFQQIDITQTQTIPINSKDAEIVTSHPKDSYKLDGNNKMVNSLVITQPEKFWSASKYLVVVTN
jgi:DNA repair exonuclease SbcCD ATPase subunit